MSVDFSACNNCGEVFCECGDYTGCDCGVMWCSLECAEEEGYEEVYDEDTDEEERTCGHCRNEIVEDYELLKFALDLLETTKEDLIAKYKNKDKL